MSDYILHSIDLTVSPQLDFFGLVEEDKPVDKYPNYYLGKIIGSVGNELDLFRTRQGDGKEHIPNCVLRNEGGIALIRIHNKENFTLFELPENTGNEVKDCVGVTKSSYPFGYVVIDYRDGKCQLAIEKTSAWDNKTVTIRYSLEKFFNDMLSDSWGITTKIKEKSVRKDFEKFIDQRTIDHGDMIESFTFEFVNEKRKPTVRIPESLTEQMEIYSKVLEFYGAISSVTTVNMGAKVDNEKLKQLSSVLAYSADNAFNLMVKFKDYGEYSCKDGVVAKYPMNDAVISNFKDFITPDIVTSDFDLRSWLDVVFEKVKEGKDDEEIPTKPMC